MGRLRGLRCWLKFCIRCMHSPPPPRVIANRVVDDDSVLAAGGIALKLNVDAETVLFAILDIFSQGILGYWLLIAYESAAGT